MWRIAEWKNRREFLLGLAKGAGAAAVGGLVWAAFLDGKKASATVLRPPGAVDEERFLAACTKCGLSIEACPDRALRFRLGTQVTDKGPKEVAS